MQRKTVLFSVCIVLILALIPLSTVQAGRSKTIYLDWHQVVPAGTGDPNAYGNATINVNAGRGELCYDLRVLIYFITSEWPPTSTGIYKAPAGENGPLIVDLNPAWGPLGDSTVSGCIHIDKALAHDIQKNPTQYYVLVTDSSYPDGALRGQLVK
ncbi:MAG: CHRD domain-containing protein [Anaerolineales bacterium]|jgi:hypothetical protein